MCVVALKKILIIVREKNVRLWRLTGDAFFTEPDAVTHVVVSLLFMMLVP
jgi:hypothetical protein